MDFLFLFDWIASLLTLTLLEVALGVDNLVMIMILCGRLPKEKQAFARRVGLGVALFTRILLLSLLFWMQHLVEPLFHVQGHAVSVQTILYFLGGLFLIGKATSEIHHDLEEDDEINQGKGTAKLWLILAQISVLDIVFSFDSVLTAIGLAEQIAVMVIAVTVATIVMVVAVDSISKLLNEHPSLKILALSYMLLVGMALLLEAFEIKIPKGYLYSAMAFSLFVEVIKISISTKKKAAKLAKKS